MLGYDVLAAIPGLRQQAESLMVDNATIRRPGDAHVFDPITGALTPSAGTFVFTGPCRLRQPTAQEMQVMFGEQQVTMSRFVACFPLASVIDARIGDLITFDESGDPDVLTRTFRITSVPLSTFSIYKGYACETVEP
jgi:hypothetical protein